MFVKTFREIGGGVEPYFQTDFVNSIFTCRQQLGTLVQSNQLNIVIWRNSGDTFDLLLEICSTDRKFTRETVYREVFVRHILQNKIIQPFYKISIFMTVIRVLFKIYERGLP